MLFYEAVEPLEGGISLKMQVSSKRQAIEEAIALPLILPSAQFPGSL